MNKKEEIKKQLTEWFNIMLAKYTWLKVKYEYNEAKECFLVSFCISSDIEDSDFDKDVLDFEELMDNKYGDYSPLFCDNERLFKLSPNAEVLSGNVEEMSFMEIQDEDSTKFAYFDFTSLFAQITPQFTKEELLEDTPYNTNYNKAA